MSLPTRQATAAALATLAAPVANMLAAGRRSAGKRLAASILQTEEHKRCRRALYSVADEWLCHNTQELALDPVMAEDLHFYERASIEEWFRRNESAIPSPVTSAPMGRALKALPQVRCTIEELVGSGAITGGKADLWKERLAQEEEVKLVRQRASAGEVEAMRILGGWYLNGDKGLKKDEVQAFSWCKQASKLGDVAAMTHVGWMYCYGKAVRTNVSRGTVQISQAAALGSDWGCYMLGHFHQQGCFGFDKDAAEASYYYAKIPGCTIKHLSAEQQARATEWLQAHPLQPIAGPAQ
jgi:hypothetical protein